MNTDITSSGPSRRSIAKGAAWAVPAVSIAAAAPSLAASSSVCVDGCIQPLVGGGATIAIKRAFASTATLTLAAGLTFTATACTGLISTGIVTLTSTTITMRYLDGHTEDFTTTQNLALGAQGAGVFATTDVLVISRVRMPNGIYAAALGVGSEPAVPVKICGTVSYQALIGGQLTTCTGTVCWDAALKAATVGLLPGQVTFATIWGP